MRKMMFVSTRVRIPHQYLLGEESPGLKLFRRLIPPFIDVEVIQQDTPEHDDLAVHSVTFDAGENFATNLSGYLSRVIDDLMGQGTKEINISTVTDPVIENADDTKLGLPLVKAIIAEIADAESTDYIEGVTRVYLIHPPQLEKELNDHLSGLPVPPGYHSPSERLISVPVREETRLFLVQPYKMDLTRRRSADPRWLIVYLYNPVIPALAITVEAQGPLTFEEPTPLLKDTKVAESWAMEVMQDYLRDMGIDIGRVRQEPNGPTSFPDYRVQLNSELWDVEIVRVLGDILETRHILDKPRDGRKMMDRAVQSSPIEDGDVENALDSAIKSKGPKRRSDGTGSNYCLLLLNPLGLDVGSQSPWWKGRDLTSFDVVVLVNGYSQPSVEFIKGNFMTTSSCPGTSN